MEKKCILINLAKETSDKHIAKVFLDRGDFCIVNPIEDKFLADYYKQFIGHFNSDAEYQAQVLFFNEISKNLLEIVGWYDSATIYSEPQFDDLWNSHYLIKCHVNKVYLISKEDRITIDFRTFDRFLIVDNEISQYLNNIMNKAKTSKTMELIKIQDYMGNEVEEIPIKELSALYDLYNEKLKINYLVSLYKKSLKLLERDKENGLLLEYIGFCLLEMSKPKEALSHLHKAFSIQPKKSDIAINIGDCYLRLNKYKEVIEWYNLIPTSSKEEILIAMVAEAYMEMGYTQIAYRYLKEINNPMVEPILEELTEVIPFLAKPNQEFSILDEYPIFISFENEILPERHTNNNSREEKYFDPIRKKGIPITPEETVRQQAISYLINNLKVPHNSILVEESLAHIDRNLKQRVDILVTGESDGKVKNLLLIECKAPNIQLKGSPTKQLLEYNKILSAAYIMVTNGYESHFYQLDKENGHYSALRRIPNYIEMSKNQNIKMIDLPKIEWRRPTFEKIKEESLKEKYIDEGIIGVDTTKEFVPICINLANCLWDEKYKIVCPLEKEGIIIEEDKGVIPMETGNAGGGTFYGNYRWFKVLDRHKKIQNVYITVCGIESSKNDDHWGNRKGTTCLYFAIEENGKPVSRLQISLDAFLKRENNKYKLVHNGARSRRKIQPLINFINEHSPYLLGKEERIELGYFYNNKNLYLSDKEVADTFVNAITYLILRSELLQLENNINH